MENIRKKVENIKEKLGIKQAESEPLQVLETILKVPEDLTEKHYPMPLHPNLGTFYNAKGTGVSIYKGRGISNEYYRGCCYGPNFSEFRGEQTYNIAMISDYKSNKELVVTNYCPFDPETIQSHMDYIRKLLPEGTLGEITITSKNGSCSDLGLSGATEEGINYYNVNFTVIGRNIYHKIVLNWLRYMYEFPYTMCMIDVIEMGKDPFFGKFSLYNRFIIVSSTMDSGMFFREDQTITHFGPLITEEYLTKKLKQISDLDGRQYLSEISNSHFKNEDEKRIYYSQCCEKCKFIANEVSDNWIEEEDLKKKVDGWNSMDSETKAKSSRKHTYFDIMWWFDEKMRQEERYPLYKKNLEFINKNNI